ncbi:5-methylcytosine-specific restriction protein A [Litorivivens lipolytica]|uniref:5-methylcytosine-specific restriction protein A n=1 Tax=Litorivivens lipolytica TaxID=1524264 RepID=A0A7W4W8S2_9GAMM|nr:5-methylcytosine-specific restriction protein A [Litorivivens lipolytica]
MPAPRITLTDLKKGIARYNDGDRPWTQTLNRVDWFIIFEEELYPLKYTYALSADLPPAKYSTDQVKAAMKDLGIPFHSLKAEQEEWETFYQHVRLASKDPAARKKRLQDADPNPKTRYVTRIEHVRNPDVVAEVLERAAGTCERCQKPAPFLRASDGTPYLEVHHKDMLANGGEDTVENAEALCPNCHRERHYGQ